MSLTSKIAVGSSFVFLCSAFIYDIYEKEIQLAILHKGVVKDIQRQELQMRNLMELNRQKHVEKQYTETLAKKEKEEEEKNYH
ncbi:hypothetical protein PGB90_002616 [Kerria lacca]